jgi:hypothetical protein
MHIKPTIFDYDGKLEITIQIAKGLESLHSGEFQINHNNI